MSQTRRQEQREARLTCPGPHGVCVLQSGSSAARARPADFGAGDLVQASPGVQQVVEEGKSEDRTELSCAPDCCHVRDGEWNPRGSAHHVQFPAESPLGLQSERISLPERDTLSLALTEAPADSELRSRERRALAAGPLGPRGTRLNRAGGGEQDEARAVFLAPGLPAAASLTARPPVWGQTGRVPGRRGGSRAWGLRLCVLLPCHH